MRQMYSFSLFLKAMASNLVAMVSNLCLIFLSGCSPTLGFGTGRSSDGVENVSKSKLQLLLL